LWQRTMTVILSWFEEPEDQVCQKGGVDDASGVDDARRLNETG